MTVSPAADVLVSLSRALDLTEGQPLGHAQRSCAIALRIADVVGLDDAEREALAYAALLKDVGCSSAAARMSALLRADDIRLKAAGKLVDWQRPAEAVAYVAREAAPARGGAARVGTAARALRALAAEGAEITRTRCERGGSIVHGLGLPQGAADAVRALDEHWNGRGQPYGLAGAAIPLLARIAGLAQAFDAFATARGDAAARAMAGARRGRWFDPSLVDALLGLPFDDPLWSSLALGAAADAVGADRALGARRTLDVDAVCDAFADVIDAKSAFTARHSRRVAEFAVATGAALGCTPAERADLRRAGLLHDVGKLGIGNHILDKPGRLTADEMATMRRHTGHTFDVLSGAAALALLARDAAAHHERLDGTGYHRGTGAAGLSQAARILHVADVYEALTAERPYRSALEPDAALAVLARDAGSGACPRALAGLRRALGRDAGLALAA